MGGLLLVPGGELAVGWSERAAWADSGAAQGCATMDPIGELLVAREAADAAQRTRLTHQFVVEKGGGPFARRSVGSTGAMPDTTPAKIGTAGSQLISNPIEPAMPIAAQKSVVLNVRDC